MIPTGGDPTHWLFIASSVTIGVGILAATWRLVTGPTLPDRVVALDLIGFLVVAILCVASIVTQQPALLFVAVVAGPVLFLGTAAFAIYLERRGAP